MPAAPGSPPESVPIREPVPDDPLARVAPSCAAVVAGARHVRIVDARIPAFAAELATRPPPAVDDPARRRHGTAEATAAYVLALDAVNFGSGWFPDLRAHAHHHGYFLVARAVERLEPVTAAGLTAVTPGAMAALLDQEGHLAARPFVAAVTTALVELGRLLRAHYEGSAAVFVTAAGGSAAHLVRQLCDLPAYRDAAVYDDEPVWLLKRAQITVADLAAALPGHPLGTFADLDRLTVLADDLVPHVLRTEGVLRYDDGLARRVDAGVELKPGSAAEVEIRAATVVAGERLRAALAERRGRPATAAELDWLLWSRGQDPRHHPGVMRPHRTRTTAY